MKIPTFEKVNYNPSLNDPTLGELNHLVYVILYPDAEEKDGAYIYTPVNSDFNHYILLNTWIQSQPLLKEKLPPSLLKSFKRDYNEKRNALEIILANDLGYCLHSNISPAEKDMSLFYISDAFFTSSKQQNNLLFLEPYIESFDTCTMGVLENNNLIEIPANSPKEELTTIKSYIKEEPKKSKC